MSFEIIKPVSNLVSFYPYSLTSARHLRKIPRHKLAEQLQIKTSELRQLEKIRRHIFSYSDDFGTPLVSKIAPKLLHQISEITQLPISYFQSEYHSAPHYIQNMHICYSTEYCDCSPNVEATLLCDFPVKRLEPVYADEYNDFILELKEVSETCDNPICSDCATKNGDLDFCRYHETTYKYPFCPLCSGHHDVSGYCSYVLKHNNKHQNFRK